MKPVIPKRFWLLLATPLLVIAGGLSLDTVLSLDSATKDAASYNWLQTSQLDFAPVTNQQYLDECGSCHFAFQPGLLPQRAWQKLMSELDNHFGDSAELAADRQQAITAYLLLHSAENSDRARAHNLSRSIKADDTPLRITDTLYFQRKHDHIPVHQVRDNPAVGSFSNCNNCHRHAELGLYNEHDIVIPDRPSVSLSMQ